ncbi:MAG: hypothetical protein HDR34_00205 [Treponema sp.]|nr:hypothetical protein [Treponema sp.]
MPAISGGGVLAFSAILALSLTFASCADNSDPDDENPSPALPANVGENPIKETIKLKEGPYESSYLELRADRTAQYIHVDDDEESKDKKTIRYTYKYSYNNEKKTVTMIVEKVYYGSFYIKEEGQLLTYSEICSKIDKEFTVENIRQYEKKYYEEEHKWIEEYYPGCDTYEEYEEALIKKAGFASFDAYTEYNKQYLKNEYKAYFSAKITYAYESEGGKMTLTEKFTGVKNLFNSECGFSDKSNYARIGCYSASIDYYNDSSVTYYYGNTVDTDKKTISFESREDGEKVNATYTEDIEAETVTIKFKDKDYVCKFEGEKYIQVE